MRRDRPPNLSERAAIALHWLADQDEPEYAFMLAQHFATHGIGSGTRPDGSTYYTQGDVHGAARTLSALRRRGLADHDGGGAWIQVRWSITDQGREVCA